MEKQSFAEDCGILAGEIGGGQTRRDLIRSALALGVAPAALALGGGAARAQAGKEVVLVNYGGVAMKAFDEAYVKPFAAQGGKLVLDGSGPLNGKILTMVQSRHVTWDICDAGITTLAELGPHNALEKIDYSIVDKTKLTPEFAYEEGVVNYMFSSVLAWDKSKISGEPTLADFFDTKKYPGRRMMRKDSQAMLELALIADGVPKDKLYPLDVKRAFAKIATIKKDLLFWSSGSESQSLMRDGECVMGLLWHTRANVLAAKADVTDEVFNVGSGEETSLRELADTLLRVMGSTLEPEYGPARKVNPVPRRLADVSRARKRIGFEASIPLEEGLRELVEWWTDEVSVPQRKAV